MIIPVLFELLLTLKSKHLWPKLKVHNPPVQGCSRSPSQPKTDELQDNFVSQLHQTSFQELFHYHLPPLIYQNPSVYDFPRQNKNAFKSPLKKWNK
ncbi:hypothetical protein HanPSC8_Chr02g0079821 [Helianthus annuus]|nr:hypothetical protein HanPSC8_Chr02g0079821 [Helianthus annuus]